MGKEQAIDEYVKYVEGLARNSDTVEVEDTSAPSCPGFEVHVENGARTIAFARPDKYNAINGDMFLGLPALFEEADADRGTRVIVLTGRGKYYSSGNDLSSFKLDKPIAEMAPMWSAALHNFVKSFIDVRKPVIAAVNGPAIGIACTTLGLCDVVIASEAATFNTPFMKIAQSPGRVATQ